MPTRRVAPSPVSECLLNALTRSVREKLRLKHCSIRTEQAYPRLETFHFREPSGTDPAVVGAPAIRLARIELTGDACSRYQDCGCPLLAR